MSCRLAADQPFVASLVAENFVVRHAGIQCGKRSLHATRELRKEQTLEHFVANHWGSCYTVESFVNLCQSTRILLTECKRT